MTESRGGDEEGGWKGLAETGRESQTIWDGNAAFWDDFMGEVGNATHRELVAPTAEKLLALTPGEHVLEIACGAGLFARDMALRDARVLATDFSEAFLERARGRIARVADRVTLRRADATLPEELDGLRAFAPRGGFDAAVCNMALMDMPTVAPLFDALPRLLRPGGRFVFTVPHPCFNTEGVAFVAERGAEETAYALKQTRYRNLAPSKGAGIVGQPSEQFFFSRTLSGLLGPAFRAGLVLDGLEEAHFADPAPDDPPLARRRFREFPVLLGVRLRTLPEAVQ